jgi:hypothetical protein
MTMATTHQGLAASTEVLNLCDDFFDDIDTNAPDEGQTPGAVRVLVCRIGIPPAVEMLATDARGSHLKAMQAIVGGFVQVIQLGDGVELWCNENRTGLSLNRVIPARVRALPPGFEDAVIIRLGDELARPGETGEWRIYGDFFLARSTADGEIIGVTDADIARYRSL